jgi:hypothetical protein
MTYVTAIIWHTGRTELFNEVGEYMPADGDQPLVNARQQLTQLIKQIKRKRQARQSAADSANRIDSARKSDQARPTDRHSTAVLC